MDFVGRGGDENDMVLHCTYIWLPLFWMRFPNFAIRWLKKRLSYPRRRPCNLWVVIFQAMYSYENLPALFRNVGFRNKGIINLLLLYWYEISICSACFVVNGLICHKGWLENDRTPSVTINRPFLPLCHQSHFWIYISRTFPPKFFAAEKKRKW